MGTSEFWSRSAIHASRDRLRTAVTGGGGDETPTIATGRTSASSSVPPRPIVHKDVGTAVGIITHPNKVVGIRLEAKGKHLQS